MNWNLYKADLEEFCRKKNLINEDILLLSNYAENLYKNNLPIIYSKDHLSKLVGYSEDFFLFVNLYTNAFYHTFSIPKHNGKNRIISEPYPSLKNVQYWILNNILTHISVSKYAKAYVQHKGIIDNVKFHKNQKVVIKLDIHDFFGSIKQEKINLLFLKIGYTKSVAHILSCICCLNGVLPQGAPTSPTLSNIYFRHIDKRLGTFITSKGMRYTRYSDDITISGDVKDKDISKIINFCTHVLKEYGLTLNNEKTKILRQSNCQYITGTVVNKKISAGTKYKREIRKEVYYICKFGLDSHMSYIELTKQNYLAHLLGKINWVLYLERNNEEFKNYKSKIINIIKEFNTR